MNFVLSFLQQIVELLTLQNSGNSKPVDTKEADPKDAYKWLIEKIKDTKQTEVEIVNDPFLQPGKIYIFKYLPTNGDRYAYWDMHPIVFALGKMPASQGFMNVGINISWYPPAARKYIIEKIRQIYKPMYDSAIKKAGMKAKDQKSVEIDLYALKTALDQYGLSFAIRNYLPGNVKSPKVCIAYEHWDKAIKLDQPRVFPELQGKVSLMQIYKDYELYVKYCNNNKGELKKKMDENKKLNRYKFIK